MTTKNAEQAVVEAIKVFPGRPEERRVLVTVSYCGRRATVPMRWREVLDQRKFPRRTFDVAEFFVKRPSFEELRCLLDAGRCGR
ncbi:MAG: hypothetical protein AB1346_00440 [Thermodesulfobacteriota bacterium]